MSEAYKMSCPFPVTDEYMSGEKEFLLYMPTNDCDHDDTDSGGEDE